jgi:crossover junction endodeoxyribonuclease RuvC
MRILGLDPGSRRLGFGLLELVNRRWRRVAGGTLRLNPDHALPRRLEGAYAGVVDLLQIHQPDLVVIEECFVAQGAKAALVLGEVRGVLLLAVQQAGIACREVSPRSVKLAAVGHGGAVKEQVQYMIPRLIDDCPPVLAPDEADALAIAWWGASREAGAEISGARNEERPS